MKIHCNYDELVDPSSLKPHPKNRNIHPKDQIKRLADILDYQGWRYPIKVSKTTGFVTSGHGRIDAAKLKRWKKVPVNYQEYSSEEQEYADLVSDNSIASWSELDIAGINTDIGGLGTDFDLDLLGIKDFVLEPIEKYDEDTEDDVPETPVEPTAKLGDLYQLGEHRLLCGDATNVQHVERLMDGNKADMVFTDPPYNVDYSNQARPKPGKNDLGKIQNDSMPSDEFQELLKDSLSCAYIVSKEDSSAYIWYASKQSVNFITATEASGWSVNQQIIWKKPMLLGRGRYQWAHEPCLFAVKGKPWFTDDRTKTTVWDFGGYDKSKNQHPTQKPVMLPEEALGNSSKIGSNILDLFGGSGSTLIACQKTNRKCYMMELEPKYIDVIVTRWEKYTGKKAELINGTS